MRFLLIMTLLPLSAGCHSLSRYPTAKKVAAASTVERNEYEGGTWVKAPVVWYEAFQFKQGEWSKCRLRTLIMRSGARTNQLHVLYEHVNWAFLNRAHDRRGDRLPTRLLGKDVHAVGITEQVAVELTDAYLKDAAVAGLDIQLRGDAGQTVVRLPPHYVEGFLAKLSTITNEPTALTTDRPVPEGPASPKETHDMSLVPLAPPQYVLSTDKKTISTVVWQDQKDRIEAGKFTGELADTEGNVVTRIVTEPTRVYETLEEAQAAQNC